MPPKIKSRYENNHFEFVNVLVKLQIFFFRDENGYSTSKEAVKKRKQRDPETEPPAVRLARLEQNAKRSAEWRNKGTEEEKDAKKAANAARMREKRKAEKLAKNSQNQRNQALPEFQRIQTVPKALEVSKSISQKGGLPSRNNRTSS